ncbi:MAG TPA: VTT domain-containing protein [Parvularculaceae bacterium]|nr:VTT domain-containing protein [Parvularculaceae bacterium]
MQPIRDLGRFLTSMDAKAATSLFVSVVLLCFVFLMFFFGQGWLQLDDDDELKRVLFEASQSAWAVPIVVSVFVILALTGFPQILLITATVLAFGARDGAFYSWLATMISATFTFGLGHWFGGRFVGRFGGERAKTTIDFIGRHGILASAIIRVVPSAPFIVVNAAAGAAHIPLWKYWAGTSVGIVPKIMIVAVLSTLAPDQQTAASGVKGVYEFFTSREPGDLALIALVVGGWLGFLLSVRWIYQRMRGPGGM